MRFGTTLLTSVTLALLGSGALSVQAAETPFYDPSNAASPTGKTIGYELFKTIGCPGRSILDKPCPGVLAAPAAPAPVKVLNADGDGDGVADALDKCPTTPAGRQVNAEGCELDGDGDGVLDALDKCPTTPAGRQVNAEGCELDGDGDGVLDNVDQCPDTPAGDRVDNKGCSLPKVLNLHGVNFDSDKDVLRPDALAILDDAVAILKRYPGLKLEVAGHADSDNTDAYNLDLSQRRAVAVMDYFVSQGVAAERLNAKGYGEAEPIADNATAAGRLENRRVELRSLN